MDGTPPHSPEPLVSVCIPHYQVGDLMRVCLRSLRRASTGIPLEILVIDNGSRDASLDWLRSLSWIRLVERPEESPARWPGNVFTAWDLGARLARGRYFVTMHSDVFVLAEGWLAPFLREFSRNPRVAAAGAWKLELEHPFYRWQKETLGTAARLVKGWLGRPGRSDPHRGQYPRDYCAMYRREVLLQHHLTFLNEAGAITGGQAIARQLWEAGYETAVFPVAEMARSIAHVTHASAALAGGAKLQHARSQRQAEARAKAWLDSPWVHELRQAQQLDAA